MISTVPFSDPLKHVLILQVTHFVEVAALVGPRFLSVELFGCDTHISRLLLLHILVERVFHLLLHQGLLSLIHFFLFIFDLSDFIKIVTFAHNYKFLIIILHNFK